MQVSNLVIRAETGRFMKIFQKEEKIEKIIKFHLNYL